MYVLLIIDMQSYWGVDNQSSVALACCREIKQAIRDKAPIIVVESCSGIATLSSLTELLDGYVQNYLIRKVDCASGAKQVNDLIITHNLPHHIRVGGVYADACVYAIVCDLVGRLSDCRIEVVSDAVSNLHITDTTNQLATLVKQKSNVVMV